MALPRITTWNNNNNSVIIDERSERSRGRSRGGKKEREFAGEDVFETEEHVDEIGMFLEDGPKNISMSIYKNNPASRFCLRIVSHRDSIS